VFYFRILLLKFNQILSLCFLYEFCLCFVAEPESEVINRTPCDMALHHKQIVCSPVEKRVNIPLYSNTNLSSLNIPHSWRA